jgi:hypothetical protein
VATATLTVSDREGLLGTITLDGDRLVGSNEVMQEIADSRVNRGLSAVEAFASLDGWSNGYVWVEAAGEPPRSP